jgi:hypothetical protein
LLLAETLEDARGTNPRAQKLDNRLDHSMDHTLVHLLVHLMDNLIGGTKYAFSCSSSNI